MKAHDTVVTNKIQENIQIIWLYFFTELQKLGNSSTSCGLKVKCGLCANQLELPADRQWKGKASYFEQSKYYAAVQGRAT